VTLTLDVDFLMGVCFATRNPADRKPDCPPQIDRIYSALVASWAARKKRAEERAALEWLECLEPPIVYASAYSERTAPPVYVPVNDARNSLEVLPDYRVRHARRFPAAVLDRSIMCYTWPGAEPSPAIFDALEVLAQHTPYVGRSASVVRCHFHREPVPEQYGPGVPSLRRIYPGRLAELERDYVAERRSSRGASVPRTEPQRVLVQASHFGVHWHVFSDAGGRRPNIRATAVVASTIRKFLLSGYEGGEAPEVISGHAEGMITAKPHLAILPLANVGWDWSDGHVMGFALCLPRDAEEGETELFRALAQLSAKQHPHQRHNESRHFSIGLPGGRTWRVVRQPQPVAASLKPERYLGPGRIWATATPIIVDRHLRARRDPWRQAEMMQLIAESCTHIGLPRPAAVLPHNHSAIRGSPAANRARSEPSWMGWTLTDPLRSRTLTHAIVKFAEPVEGPVILGAGRHFGLGVCLPIDRGPARSPQTTRLRWTGPSAAA
jgi:CRISPR-associated protein Csb2